MSKTAPSYHQGMTHLAGVDYFDPDETLITPLKRAIANKQDVLLEQNGNDALIVLGARGEYHSRLFDEMTFFSSPVANVKVTILNKGDKRIPPPETIGRDISELLWKAAFHISGGRLMQGCNPVDIVELCAWPNLTRLPHTINSPRIAALLSNHPTSIVFAARVLKISPTEIYQFYSAARCAGLAKPINSTVEEPRLEPHRNQSLLTILLHKLSHL